MIPYLAVPCVDSTNAEALRRLEAGQAPGFLLRADEQTKGRGRSGNHWTSPKGNFYGTFVFECGAKDADAAQLSFVAALALADVLEDAGLKPQLKWPNDILIDDAKISGILLEKHGPILLIGMGINIATHPDLDAYPTTSLHHQGWAVSPADLADLLTRAMDQRFQAWQATGFSTQREAWLARAYNRGADIRVRFAQGMETHGQFVGLDTDGALQLQTAAGLELVHAGQVFYP